MYLISYDLSNDRLRQKVAKELENFGRRVQYSVFECHITHKQLHDLYGRLASIMVEEKNGNVRIYTICANCEMRLQTIGIEETSVLTQEEEDLFII